MRHKDHDSPDIPECPVTPEHTRDYFHTLFYIVYIPGSGAMSGTKLTPFWEAIKVNTQFGCRPH